MDRYARLAAAALALGLAGCDYLQSRALVQPGLLVCQGDFGQFANGFMVARPMELKFVVDWLAPSVVTDSGTPGRIIALTSIELSFEVPYEGYRVAYHVNRIDGTISQRPNLGGVFSGRCAMKPLEQTF
jgi:hypothetical protein